MTEITTQGVADGLREVHDGKHGYKHYDLWSGEDFKHLQDFEIRGILGTISQRSYEDAQVLIPQSLKDRYGENARYEMARAVLNEARRRGEPELFSEAILQGGLRSTLHIPAGTNINLDEPVTGGMISGIAAETKVNALPAQVVSHESSAVLSQLAKARENILRNGQQYTTKETAQIHLSPAVAAAVAKANPGIVSPNVSFRYDVDDRGAYMIGYESSSGAAEAVAPQVRVQYTPEQLCQGGNYAPLVFNPKVQNLDVGVAWILGKMQAEFDRMPVADQAAAQSACPTAVLAPANTPIPAQTPGTGVAGGNGTSAAPTPAGGGNANKAAPQR